MKKMFAIVGVINYLAVVFLNAFTDLGHKIIIQNTVFKVYDGTTQIILSAIVNALMLLPFILAFSPSGYLSDRFAKNIIMKHAALLAVFITLAITFSYYQGWFFTAFALTFLLALQSALYSPAKYGYIKELVGIKYISEGNGAVQAVTTSAILLGIIIYTILFETLLGDVFSTKEDILKTIAPLGWLLVLGSVVEYLLALKLPNMSVKITRKKFEFAKYIKGFYLKKNLIILRRKKEVFDSVIALSLFWSISQVVLAIFGEYAKSELGITNTIIVQGVMTFSVIGIVFGSMLSSAFSKYYINIGLSTLSAFGIAVILFIIPFTTNTLLLGVEFILFGLFSGILLVPLNAKIQHLSPDIHLGTVLAGNNFVQTLFMFSFLVLTTIFAYFGMNAKVLFFIIGIVALYLLYLLLKRYFVMAVWTLFESILKIRYRCTYIGLEHIPRDSPILLAGNHVSWIDWFIVQLPLEKRVVFLIDKDIYNNKFLKPIFKLGDLIPISQKASKDSFIETSMKLKNGKIVAIFPEGEISRSSDIAKFYRGYKFIDRSSATIVPFYIDGVFGSLFARHKGEYKRNFFRKREITLYFGEPISHDIKADELREIVINLKRI
ncbi:MAG: MFS transporter [Sulfurimonas sp.]|jgi:acyl-[acyl-carrier-protein]-phospholipid O-acyltransferase/long-chain-fatty-acid--[acyl-carrier-protein] ligase|uniref:MFS transporter n=1 Tax=Sulfurimonas sp. TaxID=2022749 RepID=UPI002A44DF27|nr:MFS transporter [Sulfurimonas sp.]